MNSKIQKLNNKIIQFIKNFNESYRMIKSEIKEYNCMVNIYIKVNNKSIIYELPKCSYRTLVKNFLPQLKYSLEEGYFNN